jgi:N-acetylglucosamine kinase-like BadF-type ATPase
MSEQELLLAVDGGGTKTQAQVADLAGNVLARGLGPSSNHHRVGFEESTKAMTTAIEGALQHVLGPRSMGKVDGPAWRSVRIVAACFGLAGIDVPEDEAQIAGWVKAQSIAKDFVVVNDSELVLAAGTPDGWGVALISGTGSVCLGRNAEGRSLRVGGWGPLLGDEGSGYQMALRALRIATQTADGRASATALLQAVLRHWSLPDPNALIRHVHDAAMEQAEIAGLAAVVLNLAARGDAAAVEILNEAARDLAAQVDAVVRRLGLTRPPVALAGGLLRANLRHALQAEIKSEIGTVHYVVDPSQGAVVLARRILAGAKRPS